MCIRDRETAATAPALADVERIQALKTGALIVFAAECGAILGGADCASRAALRGYAEALGLAFQIQDDVLDVEGDPEAAGKALRKDEGAGKATFVRLMGLEAARTRALGLADEAEARLSKFGAAAQPLAWAARFAVSRAA